MKKNKLKLPKRAIKTKPRDKKPSPKEMKKILDKMFQDWKRSA